MADWEGFFISLGDGFFSISPRHCKGINIYSNASHVIAFEVIIAK